MSPPSISCPPISHPSMDVSMRKEPPSHDGVPSSCHQHRQSCHKRRTRRAFHFAAAALLTLAVLAFLSLGDLAPEALFGSSEGLLKRAVNDNGTQQGVFVRNKLYLIVVIVGFFVVIIFGVLLSAWCCRGSFRNPLCCPCYLCACCGGLACLECISCGLCIEGFEQLDV